MDHSILINKIEHKQDLALEEAQQLMLAIMQGQIIEEEIERFLVSFTAKGETIEEMTGLVNAMRTKSLYIEGAENAVDNCGTGGSGLPRINTSTIAAFVIAAAGAKVAKHGNRASSGRCGSFDVLEAAGVKIDLQTEQVKQCLDKTNLAFLFAPIFHPAMKYVVPIRKKLGKPTVFNFLGPLTNPAQVKRQVLGISNAKVAPKMIEVLKNLGSEHVLLVNGDYNLDEISVTGPSHIWELKNGEISEYDIHPKDFGIQTCKLAYVKGGDSEYNRRVLMSVLENKDREFRTELVLLNAGAALYVAAKADSIHHGYELAKQALESKKALKKFEEYKELSNTFKDA